MLHVSHGGGAVVQRLALCPPSPARRFGVRVLGSGFPVLTLHVLHVSFPLLPPAVQKHASEMNVSDPNMLQWFSLLAC